MQQVKPDEYYNKMINNPHFKDNPSGEFWAWHATSGADLFLKAYQVWGDTAFIDWGIKYFNYLLSKMVKDPDGYYTTFQKLKGKELWLDAEVIDALVMNPALKMAEVVLKDEGLKKKYGEQMQQYVDYTRKHVIEKWDKRKLWHEIGEYGNYLFGTMFLKDSTATEWHYTDDISHPYMSNKPNISNKLGITNILMWRITGDEFYRDKAEKLFYRLKSNTQHFDGHYVWHYWNPYYEKDVYPDKNDCVHWVGVHPYRPGYQSTEVSQVVEAFHNGIVFDEFDIKCIIKTNLNIMWNGDLDNPQFKNSNGREPDTTGVGGWQKEHKDKVTKRNHGTLWSSLADFDKTIRDLAERRMRNPKDLRGKVDRAYYEKFVEPVAPSFKRKYVEKYGLPVKVKDVPLGTSREIKATTVIPYIVTTGTSSVLFSKFDTDKEHPLTIELYDQAGKARLRQLF